jgi:hypothetical protein
MTMLYVALLTTAAMAAPWKPAKYHKGAALRQCWQASPQVLCCGYRMGAQPEDGPGYVVCNGQEVAASREEQQ